MDYEYMNIDGFHMVVPEVKYVADVIVYKIGKYAVAKNRHGEVIAVSEDHAEVIQKVIDHVASKGGGVVFIDVGTYYISKTISLASKSYIVIVGAGRESTHLIATADLNPMLDVSNAFMLMLVNLYIDGDKKASRGIDIPSGAAQYLFIVNCKICGFTDIGVRNGGGSGTWVLFSYITGNDNYNIDCDGGLWFIIGNSISYGGYGVALFAGANAFIEGNSIGATTSHGIYAYNAGRVSIENNTVRGCGGSGIVLKGGEFRVKGNHVEGCGYHGIDHQSGTAIIIGNICKNNSKVGTGYSGIALRATHAIVKGNRCFDDQGTKTQAYGIAEYSTADYNTIIGNDVEGNASGGIYIYGANTIVKHNIGYPTENRGVATIPAGSTRVTVSHGLVKAPRIILLTPAGNARVWYENVTDTSFDIVTDSAPSADLNIAWYAEV